MKYHQFVMYLFGYKVIDVRWQWNTEKKENTFAEALTQYEAAGIVIDNDGKEVV